jgi:hypothetical protein
MTKDQLERKLSLVPLLIPVSVSYEEDDDGNPVLRLSYNTIPGPGEASCSIGLAPNELQLQDVSNFLPLSSPVERLAALAILISPSLPE